MSAAREGQFHVEACVRDAFSAARQGTVILVDGAALPRARVHWLKRQLELSMPDVDVHAANETLFMMVVPHLGAAEAWLLGERLRRQLARNGWERAVVASACWPVQGSSAMDVVAAALAALFDQRLQHSDPFHAHESVFDFDEGALEFAPAGELLTG